MKKNKGLKLFVGLLVLGIAFYSPVLVKAEGNNQKDDKESQISLINDQEDSKDSQENDNNIKEDIINDEEVKNDREEEDDNEFDGEEYINNITKTTKGLLEVAEKEDGEIGNKIKEIAKEKDQNKNEISNKINEVKHRSKVKTFLIGTDYKNLGQLRSDMVKTSNQIDQLNRLLDKAKNVENKTVIEDQIKVLEQEQQKIGDLLVANENKFSLFGWLIKLFNK